MRRISSAVSTADRKERASVRPAMSESPPFGDEVFGSLPSASQCSLQPDMADGAVKEAALPGVSTTGPRHGKSRRRADGGGARKHLVTPGPRECFANSHGCSRTSGFLLPPPPKNSFATPKNAIDFPLEIVYWLYCVDN